MPALAVTGKGWTQVGDGVRGFVPGPYLVDFSTWHPHIRVLHDGDVVGSSMQPPTGSLHKGSVIVEAHAASVVTLEVRDDPGAVLSASFRLFWLGD